MNFAQAVEIVGSSYNYETEPEELAVVRELAKHGISKTGFSNLGMPSLDFDSQLPTMLEAKLLMGLASSTLVFKKLPNGKWQYHNQCWQPGYWVPAHGEDLVVLLPTIA
jgi:hypothetical protein